MHDLQLISPDDYDGHGEVGPFPMDQFDLRFLAQGDSWFSIGSLPPWKTSNLFDQLRLPRTAVAVNCAHPGAELVHMIDTTRNPKFIELLSGTAAMPWTALLLSGLGNDLISAAQSPPTEPPGRRLLATLPEWSATESAARYVSEPGWAKFEAHAREVVRLLIKARDRTAVNRGLPIVMHTYDIMAPRNAPAGLGFGPWLYEAVKAFGVPQADWLALSREVLTRLRALILSIAGSDASIRVIDTQGTLTPAGVEVQTPTEHWQNEIHPSKTGYRTLGDVWEAKLGEWFCPP